MSLIDQFNRKVTSLRLSVIDRCNFRCRYCITDENVNWVPKTNLLSFEEIERLVRLFTSLGIDSLRLTGGEPLVRPRITHLVKNLSKNKNLKSISMTTNGYLLDQNLEALEDASLNSLNISLDTLDSEKFFSITRRDLFYTVIDNIMTASNSSIDTKINCVALKGFNDNEIIDFVNFAIRNDLTVRFIEFMPFNGNNWLQSSFISSAEIKKLIEKKYALIAEPLQNSSQTSRVYRIDGFDGKIGFISSVSESFCQWCNRIRITAEGNLRTCLHDTKETNLLSLLRSNVNDETISETIQKSVYLKQKGHVDWINPNIVWDIPVIDREMIKIGG
ncbi:MAG: GTP 3',8-cyclase MoaA [Candidatus Thorarchaeota archaeon]